jgi:hypothetical protein
VALDPEIVPNFTAPKRPFVYSRTWPTVKLSYDWSFTSALTALHRLAPLGGLGYGRPGWAPDSPGLHLRLLGHLEGVVDLDAAVTDG